MAELGLIVTLAAGVTEVRYKEAEAAVGLTEMLLRSEGADDARVAQEARRIRSG
jgi:hypothetical protein